MNKIKGIITKYFIALAVGAAMCLTVIYANDLATHTLVDKYRILTDAFSIPGIILIMVGALVYVSTEGFFDMLSYALGRFAKTLIPFSEKSKETFLEYKTRKSQERFTGYSFLFFTGIAFLVVAGVFMILFYVTFE